MTIGNGRAGGPRTTFAGVLAAACLAAGPIAADTSLETHAERTGFRQTGRYPEVERLCAAFARAWPEAVRCTEFGRSAEGRPLLAIIASRSGALTPEVAREHGVPVLLAQGGIHAGEIDGKDAGFLALRELLDGRAAPQALAAFTLVFVPVLNADGHERFGRWNRPNQSGPEAMGWRTTAQNLNLNRDYTKADAPETRAMLRLLGTWDPIVYADLHVTDGAQFQHDVANQVEPIHVGDPGLQPTGRAILGEINRRMAARGSLPLDFYPSFTVGDDPASGFTVSPEPPRFASGYWALRNRFTLLVETHSWKDYATRVRVTRNALVEIAAMIARDGRRWLEAAHEAEARAAALGGQEIVLESKPGERSRTIEFLGYAWTRTPSAISGGLVTRYDTGKPQVWHVPLRDEIVPKLTVRAPRGGYVLPPAHAEWMSERLALHGIRFEELSETRPAAALQVFRARQAVFAKTPYEGRTTVRLEGEWQDESRDVPAGSVYVPIAQPAARLVMTLLEPQSSDSFAAWGLLNAAFERKEYMEAYVAEEVAVGMLAKDPVLAAAFTARLASDPAFAADPAARLEFFYRRHPSWDERLNLYPVFRTDR